MGLFSKWRNWTKTGTVAMEFYRGYVDLVTRTEDEFHNDISMKQHSLSRIGNLGLWYHILDRHVEDAIQDSKVMMSIDQYCMYSTFGAPPKEFLSKSIEDDPTFKSALIYLPPVILESASAIAYHMEFGRYHKIPSDDELDNQFEACKKAGQYTFKDLRVGGLVQDQIIWGFDNMTKD
jgi:hypothetical protein